MKRNASELWAQVSIVVHPNKSMRNENGCLVADHYSWHTLKKWNYPKWIIDKHGWFFRWVQSVAQCRFPKHYISFRYCGYFPETMERLGSKRLSSIAAAKAQVTKVENAIEAFKEEKSKTLWNDFENDPIYKQLLCKLEDKKFKLEQAVMAPVEETI